MNRAVLLITAFLAIAPCSRAATPFRTDLAFAFAANIPAGTHFWCAFPEFPSQWTIRLYEKLDYGIFGPTYRRLAVVTKDPGAPPRMLTAMITAPPHTSRECFLIAYRNGLQQPYRGYTAYNPFGWHTFGFLPPVQALVVQIPANARAADIANYQRMMRQQWTMRAR